MPEPSLRKIIRTRLKRMRYRAKNGETRPCNLTIDDILAVWPEDNRCRYLGFELKWNRVKINAPDLWSVDRIDSGRDYEPNNIQIISQRANWMKSSASEAELVRFSSKILEEFGFL